VIVALLAFVGLAPFFSSPHDTLYWTFRSPGAVFGPFINRNHFAFYINLCIGLAGGLLFYYLGDVGTYLGGWSRQGHAKSPLERRYLPEGSSVEPAALWTGVALALMIASNAMTLSRGGLLAMLIATFACLSFAAAKTSRFLRLEGVLFVG